MNIFIYTMQTCPNCDSAKKLMDSKGLRYIECNMDDPTVREAFTIAHPGIRQMPQIFIDDQRVGGLAGLQAALKQLKL